MQVRELFSRSLEREIKEVIKVDDSETILEEIEEYVPTEHIAAELIEVLDKFQGTINSPSDEINVWVSGFFGSGKSSFAKVLGYLLANPELDGTTAARRFFELNELPQAKALLNTIHTQAPTEAVLLDLTTSPNVLQEGEPVVLPVYRTLLREFGYSPDHVLAELEFALDDPARPLGFTLADFAAKYQQVHNAEWERQRHLAVAKNRASRVLHELDPATFPSADSWSNAPTVPEISAKWFAKRALELLARRRPDKRRLVLIVDEAGIYVSRSVDRLKHLQGLAEECQKTRGKLWLVATSQEKLTDVIDSIEGKQTELAKVKDRFAIKVDLLPSDIDEVTSKRVLDKTAAGAAKLRDLLAADRNKFTASVTLQSEKHRALTDEDFVRLYPLVPYQLQVLIDAVSARRAQGGAPQTMGGSNRTLIRHAQQLLNNPSVGIAAEPAGTLVTLDRSYVLLEDVIPTAWRHEVDQVAAKHGASSLELKVIRVIALCTDVPGFVLNSRNIAVALHPSVSADPIETDVRAALQQLVAEDRLRETDDGYALQSPEQKDWDKERRGIAMTPGDAARLRKRIIPESLSGLTVSAGRTFRVRLLVDGEQSSDGEIVLDIRETADVEGLRQDSRTKANESTVYWAFQAADDTWAAFEELHRSNEMIDRYDKPGQSDAQRALLVEERRRRDRARATAYLLLSRDVTAGTTVFNGTDSEAPTGDLRPAADKLLTAHVPKIYPQLAVFGKPFKREEIIQILKADNLSGLPSQLEDLGALRVTAHGREIVSEAGPIEVVVSHIVARKQYGEDQNGAQLERTFGAPPYGAAVEALQAVLAVAMRKGLLEVVAQAARITSSTDARLEQIFGTLPKFRAASFRPAEDSGPSLEVRAEVSEWLSKLSGSPLSLDVTELAATGRSLFAPLRQPCTGARSTLLGAGLAVPDVLTTMEELLARVASTDDELVVTSLHERRPELEAGRTAVTVIAVVIDEQIETLRAALRAQRAAGSLALHDAPKWAEELKELLDRARYGEDIARIRTLTTMVEDAAAADLRQLRADLETRVDESLDQLRTRYPNVQADAFDHAAGPLKALTAASEAAVLRANLTAVMGVAQAVAQTLDALSTTKEVRHVRVADVWSAPITSADDLDNAVSRIREAISAELSDDTEVRLQ